MFAPAAPYNAADSPASSPMPIMGLSMDDGGDEGGEDDSDVFWGESVQVDITTSPCRTSYVHVCVDMCELLPLALLLRCGITLCVCNAILPVGCSFL